MSDSNKTLQDLLDIHFKKSARDSLHTSFPAKITKVVNSNVVNVLPLISTLRPDGTSIPYQEIVDVRLQTYSCQMGDVFVSLPTSVGDLVWVMVSEKDTYELMKSNGSKARKSITQLTHDLSDCFAVPCFFPDGNAKQYSRDSIVISNKGTTITIKDGEVLIEAPVVNVEASNMNINANLTVNGNTSLQGDMEASGGSFTHNGINVGGTHKHKDVQSGSGVSGVPL